ncbi:Holliday junction resolvase RecU [Bacillus sp. B1-b2]|uniref:Holliday junction resolvase RecU n=1 Tax=Bacillus sp. B1-b2 TaxID=2653201 RepID=UPI001262452A|nr:Holliday junction resolvase RecU [Bacillus sp. B1-b2]KAB7672962.1 Holliday junction resolvase RecU [Bacillus sp. B1-b2]
MKIHYPNGRRYVPNGENKALPKKKVNYSNRGMTLEDDLNETNKFYLETGKAVIHKKPTPVQIVQVDYPKRSAAVIKEAYFKQASTTDYNGIYKGKYIDFEAKETKNSTSFPLNNFHDHQIKHMKLIVEQKGICFVIISFSHTNEIFYLDAEILFTFWERMINGGRKSIKKEELLTSGHSISLGLQPRIDYIKIIDALYHLDY